MSQRIHSAIHALQTGDLDAAENVFRTILSVNSSEVHSLHLLGVVLCLKGSLDDGVDLIEQSISLDPSRFLPYLNLGQFLVGTYQWDRASIALKEAVSRNPNSFEAWALFAQASFCAGDAAAALTALKKAAEIKPSNAEIFFNLAKLLKEEGKPEEAIVSFRRAIEVKPDFVEALSGLASILTAKDEYEEAISLYKRALAEDPEHVNSIAGLGWCFVRSGKTEEAIAYYAQELKSDLFNTDALFFLFEIIRGDLNEKLNAEFSYSHNFLTKTLELIGVSRIIAFGDSHVQLFEGQEKIEVNHVGASTAYNLVKEDSSTGGRRQVLSRVARMNSDTEAVVLCFGEVDIRSNVIKYCYQKGLSIEECVEEVVARYVSFANEIASRGFKIFIYGGYGAGGDRISIGSERERNYAAKCLNASLSLRCEENGFVYFSLHDALLDEKRLETDSSFLIDGFHLYNDGSTARGQIQTLLFEKAYKAAKALFAKRSNTSSCDLVLGNVNCFDPLCVGSLESGCLSWASEVALLETVVFDLGAVIRFNSISLELEADLDADRMNLILDGRLVEANISRESSCQWHLRPADQSVPFIGRYPMLKASSDFLLSIKGFSVQEKSLV
mgnify:CR=1 FL=1